MTSRIPSLALSVFAAFLAFSPQSHAGASNKNGNPFGNGTFFQNSGTFSAVIRGQNLSGTMLFSTGVSTNGGTNFSGGSCVISYLGSPDGTTAPGVYNGNAAGMCDPPLPEAFPDSFGGYAFRIQRHDGLSGNLQHHKHRDQPRRKHVQLLSLSHQRCFQRGDSTYCRFYHEWGSGSWRPGN